MASRLRVRTHYANLRLDVNGRVRSVDVEPEMPLLWVLRDELKLHGTKYGGT